MHFFVEEKGIFLNILVPKCIFLPLTGHSYYRESTKWTKGHLYALMGHLSFHFRALMNSDGGTGKLSP